MNKFAVTLGLFGLVASVPAYSIISLHNGIVHGQISVFGANPVTGAIGLLLLIGIVAYRLKKAE